MLAQFAASTVFDFFLIFCRVGSLFMLMPGIGEIYVPPRIRLTFALSVTLILMPVIGTKLPAPGADVIHTTVLVLGEVTVGIFIGMLARIIQSTLHIAGMIIAFQSSLASAILFDITQGSQGSVVGTFMTLLGITVFFTSNLHHVMLMGLFNSYDVFAPGKFPPIGDMAEMAPTMLSDSFRIAIGISAPLIVVGVLLYLSAGLMSRLMPQMQVFFILVPIQVLGSFYILMLTLSAGMVWYLEHFEGALNELFVLN
ncbi:MAG: flagellar biosynthetic protein FliR [Proteobacteria bacterium]|nr:flagellar biosynthetic protein FliR [Pseudomonadota bacterium]